MRLVNGDIVCVSVDLKWRFNTTTVTDMDEVIRMIVNKRYFPISGTARLVEGTVSEISKKNSVRERKMVIEREIFSRQSGGK